jgi:hypothetical protein
MLATEATAGVTPVKGPSDAGAPDRPDVGANLVLRVRSAFDLLDRRDHDHYVLTVSDARGRDSPPLVHYDGHVDYESTGDANCLRAFVEIK